MADGDSSSVADDARHALPREADHAADQPVGGAPAGLRYAERLIERKFEELQDER